MGVTGRETQMAWGLLGVGSWGIAASVTRGCYFQSDGGLKLDAPLVNDEAFGQPFYGPGDRGDVAAPNLTLTGRSRYNDWQYGWDAKVLGSPAAPTISTSAVGQTTSWQHVIDLATSTDGAALTFAINKTLYVDELTSAKPYALMEKEGTDGVMDRSYKLLGSKPTNLSSINVGATVAGAAYPPLTGRIFRKHGTFRMNIQGASALGAGDAVQIESWDFTFERPQDAPHIYGQDYVMAPADNGFPEVTFKVSYPRMTAASASSLYAALANDGVVFKSDMTFLGAFINSTDRYKRLYQFPHVELALWDGADVNGANQVKPEATFVCKLAVTSPAGMAFVNPLRLTLTQANSIPAFSL